MRVAVIHDWLVVGGGAEKVLACILECYPQAEVFTMVDFLPDKERAFLVGRKVHTSFIQRLPFSQKNYRSYMPLMPLAVESFDLSAFDLVISSSYAVAKGVITGPDQFHVSYVHSPMRYAWDLQHQYLREAKLERGLKGGLARLMLHRLRIWDYRTANGVDAFLCNSNFIARRIWKVYRRSATVIYPPVDTNVFELARQKENFYFTASRMVPYKRISLIVDAFSRMPAKRLVVVGDGPEFDSIKSRAGGNVELLGYQSTDVVRSYMQRARGFVFAALEDFGITPVEAQACGTPVIAYGQGGATESVLDGKTGIFFPEQTVSSIVDAIERFERMGDVWDREEIRNNALRFNPGRFKTEFRAFVEDQINGTGCKEAL